jgi:hypothetical protein
MPRPPRTSETAFRLGHAAEDLAVLARDFPKLVATLQDWRHGPSSGSGGPGPKNSVSDPTGNAATNLDEWGRTLDQARHLVASILRDVANLSAIRRQVVEPPPPVVDVPVGLVACANQHGCPDGNWGDHSRGRCSACAAYLRKYDRDRTRSRATPADRVP